MVRLWLCGGYAEFRVCTKTSTVTEDGGAEEQDAREQPSEFDRAMRADEQQARGGQWAPTRAAGKEDAHDGDDAQQQGMHRKVVQHSRMCAATDDAQVDLEGMEGMEGPQVEADDGARMTDMVPTVEPLEPLAEHQVETLRQAVESQLQLAGMLLQPFAHACWHPLRHWHQCCLRTINDR